MWKTAPGCFLDLIQGRATVRETGSETSAALSSRVRSAWKNLRNDTDLPFSYKTQTIVRVHRVQWRNSGAR